jgi:hypothetical protein
MGTTAIYREIDTLYMHGLAEMLDASLNQSFRKICQRAGGAVDQEHSVVREVFVLE